MNFNGRVEKIKNIGFIATRISGTDGVSLEAKKWMKVLTELGYECFYYAGELDTDPNRSLVVEEAHFTHPLIRKIYNRCFNVQKRSTATTDEIHETAKLLKGKLYTFIKQFDIDMLIIENALSIPLNIPLGIAITEFLSETCIPTIAHHHDFFWERKRFLVNAVWDYLNMAFPANLNCVQHVVINSSADHQLSLRSGISSDIIPNVMDFENPPALNENIREVRASFGIKDDELFVLQPTRVVKRKGIEHAIELISRLNMKAKLVISHASGDEGYEYQKRVMDFAAQLHVDTTFVSDTIKDQRGTTANGRAIYTLYDVYPAADLVTYPSTFEGFGNAFLEAIYFKRPIVVNNYSIYATDIKPKKVKVSEFDDFINDNVVYLTKKVVQFDNMREQMVNHNYKIATQFYSFSILRKKLELLIANFVGC